MGSLAEKKKTTLIVVRHGQSTWNLQQRWQGQSDTELTALGKKQAQAIATWFTAERHVPDVIYASDLKRAMDTAEAIRSEVCADLELQTDQRLREVAMGCFEGNTGPEVREKYPELYAKWRSESATFKIPAGSNPRGEGESQNEFKARVSHFCREIVKAHPGKVIAIACHGGTVKMMQHEFDGPQMQKGCSVPNCSINMVEASLEAGSELPSYEVKLWAHTGHLDEVTTQPFP